MPTRQDEEPSTSQAGYLSSIHDEEPEGIRGINPSLTNKSIYQDLAKKVREDAMSTLAGLSELQLELDKTRLVNVEMTGAAKESDLKIQQLDLQLASERNELALANKVKDDAMQQYNSTVANLKVLHLELDKTRLANAEMTAAARESERKIQQLDLQLASERNELALANKVKDDAMQQYNSTVANLKVLHLELDKTRLANAEMTAAARESERKMQQLDLQLASERKELALANREKDNAMKQYNSIVANLKELHLELDKTRLANAEMTAAARESERKLREMDSTHTAERSKWVLAQEQHLNEAKLAKGKIAAAAKENGKIQSSLTKALRDLDETKQINVALGEKVDALEAKIRMLLKEKEIKELWEHHQNLKFQWDEQQKLQMSIDSADQVTTGADATSNSKQQKKKR